jgi:hypothetical protein
MQPISLSQSSDNQISQGATTMAKRIIFQNDEGGVSIIVPSDEAINKYGIEAIALKDVPAGKPFKIMDTADVPTDRTFRGAWEVDPATLTDGVGAISNTFAE